MYQVSTGASAHWFTPPSLGRGVAVLGAATAGDWGSWTSLGTTPSYAVEGITVGIYMAAASTPNSYFDIAIGDQVSSGVRLIQCLNAGAWKTLSSNSSSRVYDLPIHIPANVELFARHCSTTANATAQISISGYAGGNGMPGYSALRCLTANSSPTSEGITVVTEGMTNWYFTEIYAPPRVRAYMTQWVSTSNFVANGTLFQVKLSAGLGAPDYDLGLAGVVCENATGDGPIRGEANHYVIRDAPVNSSHSVFVGVKVNGVYEQSYTFQVYGFV